MISFAEAQIILAAAAATRLHPLAASNLSYFVESEHYELETLRARGEDARAMALAWLREALRELEGCDAPL